MWIGEGGLVSSKQRSGGTHIPEGVTFKHLGGTVVDDPRLERSFAKVTGKQTWRREKHEGVW